MARAWQFSSIEDAYGRTARKIKGMIATQATLCGGKTFGFRGDGVVQKLRVSEDVGGGQFHVESASPSEQRRECEGILEAKEWGIRAWETILDAAEVEGWGRYLMGRVDSEDQRILFVNYRAMPVSQTKMKATVTARVSPMGHDILGCNAVAGKWNIVRPFWRVAGIASMMAHGWREQHRGPSHRERCAAADRVAALQSMTDHEDGRDRGYTCPHCGKLLLVLANGYLSCRCLGHREMSF